MPSAPTARELVDSLASQWQLVITAVSRVDPTRWEEPSVLPGWRVADLAGHLLRAALAADRLGAAPPGSVPLSVDAYVAQYPAAAVDVAAATVAVTAHRGVQELTGLLRSAAAEQVEILTELAQRPGAERLVVEAPPGPLRLPDHLATLLVEVVVHADDLARSAAVDPVAPDRAAGPPGVGVPAPATVEETVLHRPALRTVCRTLAGVLADRHPGHAVEMRVPPFAAVQCVAGPRHTRGTPPNVVETDPVTWVRLAAGRVGWTAATASGRVRASGDRSDLSGLLPLL